MEFERVRKLKYKAAKDIFYNVLNICYNFTYNSWYYCSCRKFYGCLLENGEESYCFICQIRIGYDILIVRYVFIMILRNLKILAQL